MPYGAPPRQFANFQRVEASFSSAGGLTAIPLASELGWSFSGNDVLSWFLQWSLGGDEADQVTVAVQSNVGSLTDTTGVPVEFPAIVATSALRFLAAGTAMSGLGIVLSSVLSFAAIMRASAVVPSETNVLRGGGFFSPPVTFDSFELELDHAGAFSGVVFGWFGVARG